MSVNTDTRTLHHVDRDGTPVYICNVCGRDFAGERECPLCQARAMVDLDDAEALGLRPRDPEVA
jgi:transposase-like protein